MRSELKFSLLTTEPYEMEIKTPFQRAICHQTMFRLAFELNSHIAQPQSSPNPLRAA